MENKFIYRYAAKKSGGLDAPEREEVVAIRNCYAAFEGVQSGLGERANAPEAKEKTDGRRKRQ